MGKPKRHQHPHWLQQYIWIVNAKSFQPFFYGFLAVWGAYTAYMINGTRSVSIAITFVSAFFLVWLLGLVLMFEANFKLWKKLLCGGFGILFLGLFAYQQFKPSHTNSQMQTQPPTLVVVPLKPEKNYGLLKNGGFENGLDSWVSNEYTVKTLYVSSDVVGTVAKAPVMSLVDGAGLGASKGLLINCDTKPGPNEYKYFAQKIEGLKPNAKYKVKFFLYRGEHAEFSDDSIYMLFDGNWPRHIEPPGEGRILKRKIENSWTEYSINLVNDANTESAFLIVVNDRAKDIRLDDISIQLSD